MESAELENFSPIAREHAQMPRNLGPLADFDGHARVTGPCGDTMEFWLSVADGIVEEATFITDGCGSSLACGSMATVLAEGRPIEEAARLSQRDILNALGGMPDEIAHCALLSANTLQAACSDYLEHGAERRGAEGRAGAKTCDTCNDASCSASRRKEGETSHEFEERRRLHSRLCRVRHKILVLSGKGGVGKSTVAVNLAFALAMAGKKVGLMDIDFHGPSVPTMLGIEGGVVRGQEGDMLPVEIGTLKVMSLGFFLNDQDEAVIWRGPMKMGAIKQFITDVAWGDLDYLIVDSPPGTGDEPLSVCQVIGDVDGAIIVTTPQKVAAIDVRKSITFCRRLGVEVLGVVENMSGFACPKCGEVTAILPSGGGRRITADMHVPFLGSIPMDPKIAEACDTGDVFVRRYAGSATAEIMRKIIAPIMALPEKNAPSATRGVERVQQHV